MPSNSKGELRVAAQGSMSLLPCRTHDMLCAQFSVLVRTPARIKVRTSSPPPSYHNTATFQYLFFHIHPYLHTFSSTSILIPPYLNPFIAQLSIAHSSITQYLNSLDTSSQKSTTLYTYCMLCRTLYSVLFTWWLTHTLSRVLVWVDSCVL